MKAGIEFERKKNVAVQDRHVLFERDIRITPNCYWADTLISSMYTSSQLLLASHMNRILMFVGKV